MNKSTSARRKRTARETRAAYADKTIAAKPVTRKPRAKKLVVEMYGGEPYEYYPLGKYVVAAPGVCGGQPSFKYTRVGVTQAFDLIADGLSVTQAAEKINNKYISPEAVAEAMALARNAFVRAHPSLRRAKRWA